MKKLFAVLDQFVLSLLQKVTWLELLIHSPLVQINYGYFKHSHLKTKKDFTVWNKPQYLKSSENISEVEF